ncbi:MAG: glycosyltransferase family 4 protein [Planctomycetota bacterium]|jgi:glycosyltransferase involved in cell wall biosynthesis
MKIIHLSTAKSWRGGEQQLLYLAQGLAREGVDQVILAPPGAPLHERAAVCEIKTRPFESGSELNPFTALRLRGILKEEAADLVHAHDGHGVTFAALGGRSVKRVCTRRVDFALNSRWKYGWGMDRVICISKAIQGICAQAGLPESKLPVVYSGIDPDRLQGDYHTRELATSFGFDRRDPVLLNVASLTDHKGQCYLLEAMLLVATKHPRVKLLIAGTGELEEALKRQAMTLALTERVQFIGFRDDLGALYSLADLFIMSSHLEGLCTSVLDAMAMQCACVVTEAGGLPELIEEGSEGRVVPAKDPQALADAICQLLDDRKLREKMGRAGRRKAREHFSFDRMVQGTLATYQDLLGGGA